MTSTDDHSAGQIGISYITPSSTSGLGKQLQKLVDEADDGAWWNGSPTAWVGGWDRCW